MVRRILPPLAVAGLILASFAVAQTPPAPLKGYLSQAARPKTERILPPPPAAGSGREADDEAVFTRTRALVGGPRWSLATADADMGGRAGMFACAIGVKLDAANAPALQRMFGRSVRDAVAIVDAPKDLFARPRPFVRAGGDAPICVAKTAALAKTASYPSGHSTLSWTWGLILAELAPDRATEIMARAREIGDSRVICGVHYVSDVEEGRVNGSVLVAALHANPEFEADLAKARAEVAAARAAPHAAPADCAAIAAAEAHPPY
jgi:acid phosphatase (class A)